MKAFSSSMLHMAKLFLTNEQGGPLAQLCVTPELPAICKTLGAIIVHTVAVIELNSGQPLLLPFLNMMAYPAQLAVSLFKSIKGVIILTYVRM